MNEAVALDLPQAARSRPRLILAGVCYVLNHVLGLPALLLIEALAVWFQSPWLAGVLGPLVYAFSWLLLAAALWLGGREIVVIVRDSCRAVWRRAALSGRS